MYRDWLANTRRGGRGVWVNFYFVSQRMYYFLSATKRRDLAEMESSSWLWIIIIMIIIFIFIGIIIYLVYSGASSTSIWLVAGALLIFIIIMALLVAFWPKSPAPPPHTDHLIVTPGPQQPAPSPATNVTFNTSDPRMQQQPNITHNHFWSGSGMSQQGRPLDGDIPDGTMSETSIPLGQTMMNEAQFNRVSIQKGVTFPGQSPNGNAATFTTPDIAKITKINPGPVPVGGPTGQKLGQSLGLGMFGGRQVAMFSIDT